MKIMMSSCHMMAKLLTYDSISTSIYETCKNYDAVKITVVKVIYDGTTIRFVGGIKL